MDTKYIFGLKEQLLTTLQNVNEVNGVCSCLAAVSRVCESTKQNGLVTIIAPLRVFTGDKSSAVSSL